MLAAPSINTSGSLFLPVMEGSNTCARDRRALSNSRPNFSCPLIGATTIKKGQSESKTTPGLRQRDRIRHDGDHLYGKGADRKSGGPRLLLPCILLPAQ